MRVVALFAVTLAVVAELTGCGGGSGGSAASVTISQYQVSPQVLNVGVGRSATWRNSSNEGVRVASGQLLPVADPQDVGPILILNSNRFDPAFVRADLGDAILFSNERTFDLPLEILDSAGNTVFLRTLGPNELISVGLSDLPRVGQYTYRRQGSLTFTGTLILSGIPDADGQFLSEPLAPGTTFTRQFNAAGTYPYFIVDLTDPNASFITGTVLVQ